MSGVAPQSSWDFLDIWLLPPETTPPWAPAMALADALVRVAAKDRASLASLRAHWDLRLAELGGDPSAFDWSTFAPLRREREEDWSDWLAQLLGDSVTGAFAWHLFGSAERRARETYVAPAVRREFAVEDRRADLIIDWADGSYTHVEVKVGDPHLGKTPDTIRKIAKAMGHGPGSDFLLILPEQERVLAQLRDGAESDADWARIHLITWRSVAVALRRALVGGPSESVRWKVWAHALCGAVEHELLGVPGNPDRAAWCRSLTVSSVLAAVDVMSAGQLPNAEDNV